MEKGFVFLDEILRGVRWDAKYATWDNFTGKPVDGYMVNRVAGTYELALALVEARRRAEAMGYGVLLWDAYRPKRAADCFRRWAESPEDGGAKDKYYPNIERGEMITLGYVAPQSSHSRGSAVDLTLYSLDTGLLLPMGGGFDLMDERSHHGAEGIGEKETRNRGLLRAFMEVCGFAAYSLEWWHYVLKDEPYPDRYFDFPIL
ncbi:MAG: D-Ala-D-Ala dipeptidase VanX [Oscillospiraceae bacterium]|jgi:D-alanyl-D-alanine dipeptidase|nr:D-Ala-D-Ala dipeptidase VanX [Oscillospiraceae bacterium]